MKNKFIDFRKADKKDSGWTVCYKNYLNVDNEDKPISRSAPLKNMILDIKNADSAADIKDIFRTQVFKYTKPEKLLTRILSFVENSIDTTILDFFAGSGTTLHATMALNAEDGGNRQCILVTNNENNICEEVTYERNRRVISGYTNAKDAQVEGLRHNNLRYYKTDFVPSYKSEENKRKITIASTDQLCIKEDCYTDLTDTSGMDRKLCRIYTNGRHKYMIIVY